MISKSLNKTPVDSAKRSDYRTVTVHDRMQSAYSYEISELMGEFSDPQFRPDLSPKQMLSLGVFGGKYMTDCEAEFPKDWFDNAKLSKKRNASLNFFQVNASQPLSVWLKKGWIHEDDPRGWFQWYCRYFVGRRHEDDQRQIARWKAMNRHIAQISANCVKGDLLCRPKQRQALLHWAYDSRNL